MLVVTGGLAACPSDPCCDSDADCDSAAICFEGMCRPRCTHSSQCDVDDACISGACVAPLRTEELCAFSTPTPTPNRDAGPGPSVDAGPSPVDAGPSGCVVDDEEPNDEPALASFAQSGAFSICGPGDSDYFVVDVPAEGWQVRARIEFQHDDGDLDLQLLGPAPNLGRVAATSQGTGNVEEIVIDPVPGAYVLHVFGFANATNTYTLSIDLVPPDAACEDDAFEDNDTRGSATPVSRGAFLAVKCPGDPDYYRIDVESGQLLTVELTYAGDVPLRLEARAPGQGVIAESATGSGTEAITVDVALTGRIVLGVTAPVDFTGGQTYQLAIALTDAVCPSAVFEPNDERSSAPEIVAPLNQDTSVAAAMCPNDVDWYAFTAVGPVAPMLWRAQIEGEPRLRARVYDASGSVQLGEVEPGGLLIIVAPAGPAQISTRVTAVNDELLSAPYTLTVHPEFLE